MKTRLKVISQIQAPCPWRRFERSSEKRRSGDTTFCMSILFSILIVSLLRFSQTCEFWSSKAAFTIPFLTAVNHLNGPLRKQNFTLTGSKGHGLWFVIGGFRSVLCVSVFQGSFASDRNYDWRQRKTQLWRSLLNFRVRMFVKSAV